MSVVLLIALCFMVAGIWLSVADIRRNVDKITRRITKR